MWLNAIQKIIKHALKIIDLNVWEETQLYVKLTLLKVICV